MDLATIIGLVVSFVLMIFGMTFDLATVSFDMGKVGNFIDPPSIMITFGGSFMCMLVTAKNFKQFISNLKSFSLALKVLPSNETETISKIIELSNVARKEGLLALEEAANNIDDQFLKKGILLIVDGTDPELVRSILETELISIETRHKKTISFWEELGAMGPAWGMIGTLIGLINMLKKMSDAASIGPNMAVALVTTFYGSLLANWICAPVASKLKSNDAMEIMTKEVMVEGLLSIQAGEN
ncbi:MAG TPA: MotA/TolQ/ExbB proton channel family protein, partial [Lachnospiraceae bacterium]|nr:MotA/TolQ/ExbB proton channel family protein [Lachnospiraceae bacterium]